MGGAQQQSACPASSTSDEFDHSPGVLGTLAVLALGTWRQEDEKLKVILSYTTRLRGSWDRRHSVLMNNAQKPALNWAGHYYLGLSRPLSSISSLFSIPCPLCHPGPVLLPAAHCSVISIMLDTL